MFIYQKKLQFPINIKNTNPKLAQIVISQYGGPDGELGASLRYLSQRYSMPYPELKALLTDIGTEELGHLEMVGTIVHQLTRNLTESQIEGTPFANYFVDHTAGVYPVSASGVPWNASYIAVKGDVITDLTEDMAAEQKARTTYDNILRLSDDPDVNNVIRFLREREIVHFQRFGEGLRLATDRLDQKNVYAINPAFDKAGVSPAAMDNKSNVSPMSMENKSNVSPMSMDKSNLSPATMDKTGVSPMSMDKTGVSPMSMDKAGVSPITMEKYMDKYGVSPMSMNKQGVSPMSMDKAGLSPSSMDKAGLSPSSMDKPIEKYGVSPMSMNKPGVSPMTMNKSDLSPMSLDNNMENTGVSPMSMNKSGVSPLSSEKSGLSPVIMDKSGMSPMTAGRPMDRWMDK